MDLTSNAGTFGVHDDQARNSTTSDREWLSAQLPTYIVMCLFAALRSDARGTRFTSPGLRNPINLMRVDDLDAIGLNKA